MRALTHFRQQGGCAIAIQLIESIALVFLLSSVQQWFFARRGSERLWAHAFSGILYGLFAVMVMADPIELAPGYIFDGRSIILAIAGLFGGPITAAIAAFIASVYRLWVIGGVGAVAGTLVIVESAAFGALFFELRRRGHDVMRFVPLLVLGLVVNGMMLWIQVFVLGEMGLQAVRQVGLTVMVLFPLATVFVALLLHDQEQRAQMRKALQAQASRLADSLDALIRVVDGVVEIRDPFTAGHQRRTAELSRAIALRMGLPSAQVRTIEVAAMLHDVGKISVPAEILCRPGGLSPTEQELVHAHAEAGYRILDGACMEESITEVVRQHHERCDGSGYPRGLTCADLLLGAKILAVADVVEAMSAHRPYRPSRGLELALDEIRDGAGTRYDRSVVDACLDVFEFDSFRFDQAAGVSV